MKLFRNLGLKLVSVVVAVILWFVIMSFADPSSSKVISFIPISLVNDNLITDSGSVYSVDGSLYASVRVTGTTSVLNQISAADFSAVADVASMYDLTGQVPVVVTCSSNLIEAEQIEPLTRSVRLNIETIMSRRFPITVETVGKIMDGFLMGQTTVSPTSVVVSAPESVIAKIDHAGVSINISNLSEPAEYVSEIILYNDAGEELNPSSMTPYYRITSETATVTAEVFSVKTLPIIYSVQNQSGVASGFRFTGAELSKTGIQVQGLKSRLAELTGIVIPDGRLDVAGAAGDIQIDLNIAGYLPDTVKLTDPEDQILHIVLHVEQLVTDVYDVINQIELYGIDRSLEYHKLDSYARLWFRALKEDFNHFSVSMIHATVDVSDLGPGTYDLPVSVRVDDDVFERINELTIRLEIVDPGASQQPVEQPPEELLPPEQPGGTGEEPVQGPEPPAE